MKKYTLLFIVITQLLLVRTGFCQTCDCEALKTEIDNLKNQLLEYNQSSISISPIIEPTDYHEQIYIDKDYRLYFSDFTEELTLSNNVLKIPVYFSNPLPFQTRFKDKVIVRAYQNDFRLQDYYLESKNTDRIIKGNSGQQVTLAYILINNSDDVTLEICEAVGIGNVGHVNHVATWVIPLSDAVKQ